MQEILQSIVLGIVQGITEFLPVSSSGHLELIPWLFGWQNPSFTFDAALHLGTMLAILIFFWKDFWNLVITRNKLIYYIVLGSIPGALIGFVGEKFIEDTFHQGNYYILVIASGLIIFGLIMYWVDRTLNGKRTVKEIELHDALTVGTAQAVALIPGVSRSGVTITAGLLRGLTRESATRFSFLLSAPITFGAGLYKVLDLKDQYITNADLISMIIGVITSAVVGIITIQWLLKYLTNHSLKTFVVYRIVVGIVLIIVFVTRL